MRKFFLLALLLAAPVGAVEQIQVPPLITQMAVLVGLSLLPYLVMILTSFVKIVMVLSLLRSALGLQQSPPNQVINGIALLLTLYVMFPTGAAMYNDVKPLFGTAAETQLVSAQGADFIISAADKAKEPLRQFLLKNTRAKQQRGFYQLAQRYFPSEVKATTTIQDFLILIPAFLTSQVEDAFQIGVLIYLPFFIVDLVVSNILLAMGMMMLSPMTISLPLKLLLLVMIDGWSVLVQGLVLSFKP